VAAATACGPRVHTPGNSASRYAIESLPRTTGLDWLGMVLIIINRYPPIHRSGNWMSSIESPVSGGIKYHMYIYIYEHALACIEAAEIYFSHIYIYIRNDISSFGISKSTTGSERSLTVLPASPIDQPGTVRRC
jgi:hypothetical protein